MLDWDLRSYQRCLYGFRCFVTFFKEYCDKDYLEDFLNRDREIKMQNKIEYNFLIMKKVDLYIFIIIL